MIPAAQLGLAEVSTHVRVLLVQFERLLVTGAGAFEVSRIAAPAQQVAEVRKSDWTPRSVHRTVREMSEVVRRIENETGREARASDVAEALGISVEDYHRAIADAASCRLFSFDQMGSSDDDGPVAPARDHNPGPQDDLEEDDFRKALAAAIEGLPERSTSVSPASARSTARRWCACGPAWRTGGRGAEPAAA